MRTLSENFMSKCYKLIKIYASNFDGWPKIKNAVFLGSWSCGSSERDLSRHRELFSALEMALRPRELFSAREMALLMNQSYHFIVVCTIHLESCILWASLDHKIKFDSIWQIRSSYFISCNNPNYQIDLKNGSFWEILVWKCLNKS